MVVLVLDDPRLQPRELLVVLHEIGIHVAHPDRERARHVGMDAGKREAALVVGLLLGRVLVNLGIQKGPFVVGARRVVLGPRRAVHDEQADVLADLRRGQPDAFGLFEREEHVLGEFLHFGVVGTDLPAALAQHLVPVYDNRINHNLKNNRILPNFIVSSRKKPRRPALRLRPGARAATGPVSGRGRIPYSPGG